MNSENLKNKGFQIPKGYFEKLETQLLQKLEKNDDGFTIPDNYFEKVKRKLSHRHAKTYTLSYPKILSIAAVGILLLIFGSGLHKSSPVQDENIELAYLDYLMVNGENFSDEDLFDLMDEDMIEIDDNLLIDYLESADIDIEDIKHLIF